MAAVASLPHVSHLQFGNIYDTTDCKYQIHRAIITDRALQSIGQMPKLAYLSIDNANITDEGIQQLSSLKSIKNIQIFRCPKVTSKGIERLRATLPRVDISAHGPDLKHQPAANK